MFDRDDPEHRTPIDLTTVQTRDDSNLSPHPKPRDEKAARAAFFISHAGAPYKEMRMLRLADLFGFAPPFDASQSNAPMNMPIGPPWADPLKPSAPLFTSQMSGLALQPANSGPWEPFASANTAGWPSPKSTFEAMLPPARSPPAIPTGGILGGHPAVRANDANSPIAGGYPRPIHGSGAEIIAPADHLQSICPWSIGRAVFNQFRPILQSSGTPSGPVTTS